MVCTSRIQAGKVAAAGADKAQKAGYIVVPSEKEGVCHIVKPGGTGVYTVEEKATGFVCECEFFQANAQYGVCKHIILIIRHKEEEAAYYETIAERFARPIDAPNVDALNPVIRIAALTNADHCGDCGGFILDPQGLPDFGNGYRLCAVCQDAANSLAAWTQEA